MRIISGSRRGHKLLEFSGQDVRPTTDRVKESIFNIIQGFVPEARVLDMFCGSGALSFEALSRGAAGAVCLDIDARSIDIIRKNAAALKFGDRCEILNISCFDYISREKGRIKFDIIFLDPPYNKGLIEPVLEAIVKNDVLSNDGIVVLESDSTDFRGEVEGLTVYRQRRYGRTYITVYKKDEQ
ncbi:MAG: 16S rRNA (guanine(966)-N(2))-methyltransferase RsmD [bacterium]|nr:16S rRNA (guanine(966)-N(2))-methyltransferase RsmD [bacterium]